MLVKPPQFVQDSLSAKVEGARLEGKFSSLDAPKIAAVHLKTKEDLALFYGNASELLGVPVALQIAVWAMTAIALAFGGNSQGSSSQLNQLPNTDVLEMTVDELLNERRAMMG